MLVMVVVVVICTEPVRVRVVMAVFRTAMLPVTVAIMDTASVAACIAVEVGAEAETVLVGVAQVVSASAEGK
jgi:hypothetical protein